MSLNLEHEAQKLNTPCYVYDFDSIKQRVGGLRGALNKNVDLLYAMKANPNPVLLRAISEYVDGIDISSFGELELASRQGLDSATFSFAGPGKTEEELLGALKGKCGILSVESMDELDLLVRLAREVESIDTKIMLRVNLSQTAKDFSLKMSGRPTQFGIDESGLAQCFEKIKSCEELEFVGIHVYAGTQCLSLDGLEQGFQFTLDLAGRLIEEYNIKIKRINLGGGVGIPLYESQNSLALDDVAAVINRQTEKFSKTHKETLFTIELGRYLVGEFGYYLSKIVSIKESHGESIIILDGGMHHHLAASGNLGQGLRKNYQIKKVSLGSSDRPVSRGVFKVTGCLCTPIDLLGVKVSFPEVKVGDVLVFCNSGAYGFTASPLMFLGHETPEEIMYEEGSFKVIRKSKKLWELF